MSRLAILAFFALSPALAAAHPDHLGSQPTSLGHLLTDPFHIGVTLVVSLPLVWLVRRLRRRSSEGA